MFNSPVLDTAIGLVFIFLLYSLLATSIKECIAALFGLRARMLKNGIVDGMLSNTSDDNRWMSILKGIASYAVDIFHLIIFKSSKSDSNKLGDKFYAHPLIKNYGASRIYPTPSYIPAENFSNVLLDILKNDFYDKLNDIATYKSKLPGKTDFAGIVQDLQNSSDAIKIKELLEFYRAYYLSSGTVLMRSPVIENETVKILLMHLHNSIYNTENFKKKIEVWFNESMDRVAGWYKRQVQTILFIIGIVIATMFNVDTIGIAGKLSTDKNARDKIVELAIKESDKYKDDPNVKKDVVKGVVVDADTPSNKILYKQYQAKIDSAKKLLDNDINDANNLLALGWDPFGRNDSIFIHQLKDRCWWIFPFTLEPLKNIYDTSGHYDLHAGSHFYSLYEKQINGEDSSFFRDSVRNDRFFTTELRDHPVKLKTAYVWFAITKTKLLGFLLTAFAICLGAPFWFDLLSKLIKLRAAGKQESTNNSDDKADKKTAAGQQPVAINVNTQNNQEAVG
jgi:hypothetical protein